MFPYNKSRRGQAGLEYLALAVFVMLGIIIGGPYVIRGINSHFKAIEEGAIDSEREKITEGDGGVVLPDCTCSDFMDAGCGNGITAHNGVVCAQTQKVFKRSCSLLGCEEQLISAGTLDHVSECRNDPTNSCCATAIASVCGNDLTASGTCKTATGGLRDWTQMCGSPTATLKTFCRSDSSCIYTCQALGTHATWCNEAVQNINLVSPNWPVTYKNAGACAGDVKCEAQCVDPYVTDTRYLKGCCGGGVGGIIINGGPYLPKMQSDGFDLDGPDCIATPFDSYDLYGDPYKEDQVYHTINKIFSNAGAGIIPLINQSQTDDYAVGGSDFYWSPVVPGDVFFAVVSYNVGSGAPMRFGVYNFGNPAGGSLLTTADWGYAKYTGNGTSGSPYKGGKFVASGPVGFIQQNPLYGNLYSDPSLNSLTHFDQMVSFKLSGLNGKSIWINDGFSTVQIPLTADTYLLGFECSPVVAGSDWDYNDMFVLVTKIKPIP